MEATEQQPQVEPQVEQQQAEPSSDDVGGLPSEQKQLSFELTDEIKENYLKGDKILGKYESLEQLIESHKHLQDKHAQYVDGVKSQEKEIVQSVEQQQQELVKTQTVTEATEALLSNGMEFTEELEAKIEEVGVSKSDVELAAYKAKEAMSHQYDVAGGKEQYEQIMQFATQVFDESQQQAIMSNIRDNQVTPEFRELALLGLKYKMEQDGTVTEQPQRISGETVNVGIKPYEDKRSLFADKAYIDSPAGKRDTAAQKRYRARLAVTPEEVWRG